MEQTWLAALDSRAGHPAPVEDPALPAGLGLPVTTDSPVLGYCENATENLKTDDLIAVSRSAPDSLADQLAEGCLRGLLGVDAPVRLCPRPRWPHPDEYGLWWRGPCSAA